MTALPATEIDDTASAADAAQTRTRQTGAHAVVRTLEALGVTRVFGYPGGAIMPVYDALTGSSLKHILVRHEQAAAFAADAQARLTGKAGVCLATSGPGATNLLTGIANAYLDSVPMIILTGQVPSGLMGDRRFPGSRCLRHVHAGRETFDHYPRSDADPGNDRGSLPDRGGRTPRPGPDRSAEGCPTSRGVPHLSPRVSA